MEAVRKHLRTMQLRFLASLGCFTLFTVIAIVAALSGRTMHNDTMLTWIVPLALSIAVLPRSTQPDFWPRPADEDEDLQMDHIRSELTRLQLQAMYVRFGYLATAAVVLGLLPRSCA